MQIPGMPTTKTTKVYCIYRILRSRTIYKSTIYRTISAWTKNANNQLTFLPLKSRHLSFLLVPQSNSEVMVALMTLETALKAANMQRIPTLGTWGLAIYHGHWWGTVGCFVVGGLLGFLASSVISCYFFIFGQCPLYILVLESCFFLQIPPKMGGSLNLMNIQDDSRTLTPSGRTNNTSLLGINCLGLVGHN